MIGHVYFQGHTCGEVMSVVPDMSGFMFRFAVFFSLNTQTLSCLPGINPSQCSIYQTSLNLESVYQSFKKRNIVWDPNFGLKMSGNYYSLINACFHTHICNTSYLQRQIYDCLKIYYDSIITFGLNQKFTEFSLKMPGILPFLKL